MRKIMQKEDISRIEQFAKKISESLWNQSGTGRAAVMVGAGFSMNAIPIGGSTIKMLNWNELVSCMREELNLSDEYQPDALELAELYEAEFGRQKLEQFLEKHLPDANMSPGPLHKKLLSLPWSDVFTTNYDTLLERAADEITKYRYHTVLAIEDIPETTQPRIVKLHGTFHKNRPLIFTEQDYLEYPIKSAAFVNLVQEAIMENSLCLIGFSGNDSNFKKWMGWVKRNLRGYQTNIYLIGVLQLSIGRRKLLEKLGVTPIDLSPLVKDGMDYSSVIDKFLQMLKDNEPKNPLKKFLEDCKGNYLKAIENQRFNWITLSQKNKEFLRFQYGGNHSLSKIIQDFNEAGAFEKEIKELHETIRYLDLCESILENDEYNCLLEWLRKYIHKAGRIGVEIGLFVQNQANLQNKQADFADITLSLEKLVQPDSEYFLQWLYQKALFAERNFQFYEIRNLLEKWPEDTRFPYWNIRKAGLLVVLGRHNEANENIKKALQVIQRGLKNNPLDITLISQEAWGLFFQQALLQKYNDDNSFDELNSYAVSRWAEYQKYDADPRLIIDSIETQMRKRIKPSYYKESGYDIGTINSHFTFYSSSSFCRPSELNYFLFKTGLPLRVGSHVVFCDMDDFIKNNAEFMSLMDILPLIILNNMYEIAKWYFSRLRVVTFEQEEAQFIITRLLDHLNQIHVDLETKLIPIDLPFEILSRLCIRMNNEQKIEFQSLLKRWEPLKGKRCMADFDKYENRLMIAQQGLSEQHIEDNLDISEIKKKIDQEKFIDWNEYPNIGYSSNMEERIWEYYWLCWHNIPSPFWKKKEKKFVSWDGNDARKLLKKFEDYFSEALLRQSQPTPGIENFHIEDVLYLLIWDVLPYLKVKETMNVIDMVLDELKPYHRPCLRIQLFYFRCRHYTNAKLVDNIILGLWSQNVEVVADSIMAIVFWIIAYDSKIIFIKCPDILWKELLRTVESQSGKNLLGAICALCKIIEMVPDYLKRKDLHLLELGMEKLFDDTELTKQLILRKAFVIGNRTSETINSIDYQRYAARLADTLFYWYVAKKIEIPCILNKWKQRCQESCLPEINCYFKDC